MTDSNSMQRLSKKRRINNNVAAIEDQLHRLKCIRRQKTLTREERIDVLTAIFTIHRDSKERSEPADAYTKTARLLGRAECTVRDIVKK